VHPHRHRHPGRGGQRDLPVDARRLAAGVALRRLPHAEQRVAPAAQHQLLYFFCVGRQQRRTGCQLPYLSALDVEQAVERYYVIIRVPEEVQEAIRTGLCAELDQQRLRAEPEIAYAQSRVTELEGERRRLARGVVTGAIPEDLAREEQERITRELGQAQRILATAEVVYEHIEDTLNRALALVGRVDEVYRRGGPQVRRMSNQFLFEQLLIDVEENEGAQVVDATLREPWDTLLAPSFQAAMATNTTNPDRDLVGRGSK
jgi:hypothetical protein